MSKEIKFLVTQELGRLAKWLRILGFDTKSSQSSKKSHLIINSLRENRIILTKNKNIGSRQGVRVIQIRSDFFKQQLKQVIEELSFKPNEDKFFMRCVICNEILELVEKDKIKERVPAYVFETQKHFVKCPSCRRVYWPGTHWGNVEVLLSNLI